MEKYSGRYLMSYFSLHIYIRVYVRLHTTHAHFPKTLLESIPPKSLNINKTLALDIRKINCAITIISSEEKEGKYQPGVVSNLPYSFH